MRKLSSDSHAAASHPMMPHQRVQPLLLLLLLPHACMVARSEGAIPHVDECNHCMDCRVDETALPAPLELPRLSMDVEVSFCMLACFKHAKGQMADGAGMCCTEQQP